MIAFHGDPLIKQKYLDRVREHRRLDQIVKGKYWENGKGCAVGCTIHSNSHKDYETELGIPKQLAYLEDSIFENLPNDLALEWPEKFLDSIPVGADLSLVWPQFAVWLLVDTLDGVIRFAKTDRTKEAIQTVAEIYSNLISGNPTSAAAAAAAAAAATTAASAAAATDSYSAAYAAYAAAAAAYAATTASSSAAAAFYAADSADAAIYADDSRESSYIKISEKFLELLLKI